MKTMISRCALVVMLFSGFAEASASIIAQDDFYYTNSAIAGKNGGTGWTTAWTGSFAANVNSNALKVAGNFDNDASRKFSAQSGTEVFFSFNATFNGVANSNDFLALWIDNGSGAPTGAHTSNANIAIKSNTGPGSTDYTARMALGDEAYSSHQLVAGTTVQLVGRLYKQASANFNRISLWVNPSPSSLGTPDATANNAPAGTPLSTISRIGFRSANLDSGDSVVIDDLVIGTSFTDVVAPPVTGVVPEPASILTWIGLSGIAGLVAARKRKMA